MVGILSGLQVRKHMHFESNKADSIKEMHGGMGSCW